MITVKQFLKERGGIIGKPPNVECFICHSNGFINHHLDDLKQWQGEDIGTTRYAVCLGCNGKAIPAIPMSELI